MICYGRIRARTKADHAALTAWLAAAKLIWWENGARSIGFECPLREISRLGLVADCAKQGAKTLHMTFG